MWLLFVTSILGASMSVIVVSGIADVEECFSVGHAYRLGNGGQAVSALGGRIEIDCVQVR